MRNLHLKSIALFSGSFFVLILLFFSTHLYAIPGALRSIAQPTARTVVSSGAAGRLLNAHRGASSSVYPLTQHPGMDGKAGHHDKRHTETDLFAGANKAGAPAASQALVSD